MRMLLIIVVMCIVVVGCSTRNFPMLDASEKTVQSEPGGVLVASLGDDSTLEHQSSPKKSIRKIIRSGSISLIVETLRDMTKDFERIATKYDGYVVSSGQHNATVRIASNKFNAVIEDVSSWGQIDYKNIYSQDVTEEYYDTQIRLENALKSRERYLQLLQQATNVTETLLVEKELERLNGVIELYQGQLNKKDHLITYSTLEINLREKYESEQTRPGPLGYVFYGIYKGARWLFIWD